MKRLIKTVVLIALGAVASSTILAREASIQAPDRVHILQRVDVAWTIDDAGDDATGALIEIRPLEEGARRAAYTYVRDNPQPIEAPEEPGDYLLVLTRNGDVLAEQPLHVVMAEATVSGPGSAEAGETIQVSWSGPASRRDMITWAARDGEVLRGSAYGYVGDAKDGERSLRAPSEAGKYDLVYRTGSTILARHPVSVGSISASVSAPTSVHAGGRIEVRFDGPENTGDRLTFSDRDGEARSGIGSYVYIANTTGNTASLRVGETTGEFDVVYVANDRVIGRAPIEIVPASVTLDGPDEVDARLRFQVDWQGAGNAGDRIVIVGPGDAEFDYQYIDPAESHVEIAAPETVGDYTLRFISRGGRVMATEPLKVTPAPMPPGELVVIQNRAALGSDDAVEIILDASGSMLQRLGGERRIEIARDTLVDLVNDTIPEGTGFALRVFGHREADSCRTDLEIPLGPLDAASTTTTIAGINAMNLARTPLGASIARVSADLAGVTGQRVVVVLTDGEETCDGDAAGAIADLRALGWDIRVNIVGFAIDQPELAQTFESWAAAGGGRYFSAGDADGLAEAMTRAVATRFQVIDDEGREVATGLTGGDPITLAPGNYRVVGAGYERTATVVSDKATTVRLNSN